MGYLILVCSYENTKIGRPHSIVAYFCNLEDKDLRKLKRLNSFISGQN